jgi:hypothetical protein
MVVLARQNGQLKKEIKKWKKDFQKAIFDWFQPPDWPMPYIHSGTGPRSSFQFRCAHVTRKAKPLPQGSYGQRSPCRVMKLSLRRYAGHPCNGHTVSWGHFFEKKKTSLWADCHPIRSTWFAQG